MELSWEMLLMKSPRGSQFSALKVSKKISQNRFPRILSSGELQYRISCWPPTISRAVDHGWLLFKVDLSNNLWCNFFIFFLSPFVRSKKNRSNQIRWYDMTADDRYEWMISVWIILNWIRRGQIISIIQPQSTSINICFC